MVFFVLRIHVHRPIEDLVVVPLALGMVHTKLHYDANKDFQRLNTREYEVKSSKNPEINRKVLIFRWYHVVSSTLVKILGQLSNLISVGVVQ